MKKTIKYATLALSILPVISLSACSNATTQKQSDIQQHPTAKKVESSKIQHQNAPQKTSLNNQHTYEQPAAADNDQIVQHQLSAPNKATANTESVSTPTVAPEKAAEYHHVNTAEDAISLYQHYLGISGSDAYSAQPIAGGFFVKPNEAAYGHQPFIITNNGDMYSSDGSVQLAAFDELAAPYAGQPESGWHGFL